MSSNQRRKFRSSAERERVHALEARGWVRDERRDSKNHTVMLWPATGVTVAIPGLDISKNLYCRFMKRIGRVEAGEPA
jgi:hypothetical protein